MPLATALFFIFLSITNAYLYVSSQINKLKLIQKFTSSKFWTYGHLILRKPRTTSLPVLIMLSVRQLSSRFQFCFRVSVVSFSLCSIWPYTHYFNVFLILVCLVATWYCLTLCGNSCLLLLVWFSATFLYNYCRVEKKINFFWSSLFYRRRKRIVSISTHVALA